MALLWYFEDYTLNELIGVLELDKLYSPLTLLGLEFGLFYGIIVLIVSQAPLFKELSSPQTDLLKKIDFNWFDIFFISFCAGFGEEILFRAGIQTWLGPWITSLFFIAIHGYFSITSFKKNALGLLLFPFILLLSFAYDAFGLWFCIAAHFAYDFLMFAMVLLENKERKRSKHNVKT
ncbi:MAG TPA: CPBP family intramembrane glutamic endopeptidase [Brumimicrobium sp.]|nr:CPBP family intramembrane glutamic endopeptidase [Brumimicrobium sp.]